jgi:ribosome-binding factor A
MAGSLARRPGGADRGQKQAYPRVARVNALLVEVLAEALEPLMEDDDRLGFLTVTGVRTHPDLRHATVFFASLSEEASEALADHRVVLQATIARRARMKRTPTLEFLPDPAVAAGNSVEDALRRIARRPSSSEGRPSSEGPSSSGGRS